MTEADILKDIESRVDKALPCLDCVMVRYSGHDPTCPAFYRPAVRATMLEYRKAVLEESGDTSRRVRTGPSLAGGTDAEK